MKTRCSKDIRLLSVLCGGLAVCAAGPPAGAQEAPVLEIALYPGIRVTDAVGTTYVIESKGEVEGGFWLTRGWIELTTSTAMWMDPVPTDSPRKVYRAVKVTKPVVQTVANMVTMPCSLNRPAGQQPEVGGPILQPQDRPSEIGRGLVKFWGRVAHPVAAHAGWTPRSSTKQPG